MKRELMPLFEHGFLGAKADQVHHENQLSPRTALHVFAIPT